MVIIVKNKSPLRSIHVKFSYSEILALIENFYAKAKIDFMIGYHFRNITDFDTHIPHIADFWHLQLNGKLNNPEAKFNVLNKHVPLGIKKGELNRWVVLFFETLDEDLMKNPSHEEIISDWKNKVEHFKQKFLSFKLLFN